MPTSISFVLILLAAAGDTNPKRLRGLQRVPSLTFRISVECPTPDRAVYIELDPPELRLDHP